MNGNDRKELTILYKESVAGGYVGFLNEMPGVMSQGETMEELTSNIVDAMFAMFEALKQESKGDIPHTMMEGYKEHRLNSLTQY